MQPNFFGDGANDEEQEINSLYRNKNTSKNSETIVFAVDEIPADQEGVWEERGIDYLRDQIQQLIGGPLHEVKEEDSDGDRDKWDRVMHGRDHSKETSERTFVESAIEYGGGHQD